MRTMLFSDGMKPYVEPLPPAIADAVNEIKAYFKSTDLKIVQVDQFTIGIVAEMEVNIPTRGTVGNIDIRIKEPVLIGLRSWLYPSYAPAILSNRRDFPKHQLSHLYATKKDDPAILCLVRGNVHEWFAGKRIENLLDLAGEWFYKAANGKLATDGEEFDPIRLDSYAGYHIYRYNKLQEIIEENISFLPGQSFACLISTSYSEAKGEAGYNFKSEIPVQAATIDAILQSIKKTQLRAVINIAILVWHPYKKIFDGYDTQMPGDYASLRNYFNNYDVDIDTLLQTLKQYNYTFKLTPIIHAIKRPKKMIGFNGDYEFVNFLLKIISDKKGRIEGSSPVLNQSHIEPFSSELAEIMTGEKRDLSSIFIGAGSLGAKIILHDARGGKNAIGVCDEDKFLQHNLVRHPLFARHVGENKATALIAEIREMFESEPAKILKDYPYSCSLLVEGDLLLYDWLIDSTASQNVLNWISEYKFAAKLSIARCELVNAGKTGLLYIEGKNRNPRIDDLVNLAYFRSLTNRSLSKWRLTDAGKAAETLDIGLGCNSISVVIADDTITQHAAVFSRLLQNEKQRATIGDKGLLFINNINNAAIPQSDSQYELVAPFDIFGCHAQSGWELRVIKGIRKKLLALCRQFKPKETGGVLIGICNYKTKTIHVFDFIHAPKDSKRTTTSFIRGIAGLPGRVDQIKEKTGGLIGYIGEWHTHPMQLESLSDGDKDTIAELLPINNLIPIPTLSLVVTNNDLLPFIFN